MSRHSATTPTWNSVCMFWLVPLIQFHSLPVSRNRRVKKIVSWRAVWDHDDVIVLLPCSLLYLWACKWLSEALHHEPFPVVIGDITTYLYNRTFWFECLYYCNAYTGVLGQHGSLIFYVMTMNDSGYVVKLHYYRYVHLHTSRNLRRNIWLANFPKQNFDGSRLPKSARRRNGLTVWWMSFSVIV